MCVCACVRVFVRVCVRACMCGEGVSVSALTHSLAPLPSTAPPSIATHSTDVASVEFVALATRRLAAQLQHYSQQQQQQAS